MKTKELHKVTCTKCGGEATRKRRLESSTVKCWYIWWDVCSCGMVKHYNENKRQPTDKVYTITDDFKLETPSEVSIFVPKTKKYWYKPPLESTINKRETKFNRKIASTHNKKYKMELNNAIYKMKLKRNATKEEIIVGDWMFYNNIKFTFQKGFFKPFHRIADFYISNGKFILEIDGGYHTTSKTINLDKTKDVEWKKRGYTTIRITNDEVNNNTFIDKLQFLL